eukprot:1783541-Pyramimonas_sp.AAC.1
MTQKCVALLANSGVVGPAGGRSSQPPSSSGLVPCRPPLPGSPSFSRVYFWLNYLIYIMLAVVKWSHFFALALAASFALGFAPAPLPPLPPLAPRDLGLALT